MEVHLIFTRIGVYVKRHATTTQLYVRKTVVNFVISIRELTEENSEVDETCCTSSVGDETTTEAVRLVPVLHLRYWYGIFNVHCYTFHVRLVLNSVFAPSWV